MLALDDKYRSRKLALAVYFSVIGTIALFTDKVSGDQFVFLAGVVLGMYGAANVMEKRL